MAISRLTGQDATGTGSGSATATYANNATPGNLLIAVVGDDAGAGIPALTGFTVAVNPGISGTQITIFYKVANGSEKIITCSYASAGALSLSIFEYTGTARSFALDKTGSATSGVGTGLTATGGTTATTTEANELLIAAANWDTANVEVFASATNSFNQRLSTSPMMVVDRIVAATGAYVTDITITGTAAGWTSAIATFKAQSFSFYQNKPNLRPHPFSPGLAR